MPETPSPEVAAGGPSPIRSMTVVVGGLTEIEAATLMSEQRRVFGNATFELLPERSIDKGELGLSYSQVGSVAQSLGRAAVDRETVTREQVVEYMLSDRYDEDELWDVLGPLIDKIEDAALADEDGDEEDNDDPGSTSLEARGQTMPADFEDDEPGLVLQPPTFDALLVNGDPEREARRDAESLRHFLGEPIEKIDASQLD